MNSAGWRSPPSTTRTRPSRRSVLGNRPGVTGAGTNPKSTSSPAPWTEGACSPVKRSGIPAGDRPTHRRRRKPLISPVPTGTKCFRPCSLLTRLQQGTTVSRPWTRPRCRRRSISMEVRTGHARTGSTRPSSRPDRSRNSRGMRDTTWRGGRVVTDQPSRDGKEIRHPAAESLPDLLKHPRYFLSQIAARLFVVSQRRQRSPLGARRRCIERGRIGRAPRPPTVRLTTDISPEPLQSSFDHRTVRVLTTDAVNQPISIDLDRERRCRMQAPTVSAVTTKRPQ